jgi:hypothetical protein
VRFDAREFLNRLYRPSTSDAGGTIAVSPEPITWAQRAASLLANIDDADRRADLREHFEDRAAICEYDGGMSRNDAERMAFEEIRREDGASQAGEIT